MNFLERIRTIERIDQLIRLKATGSPEELASKLGVTRSTVYEYIECMKDMDAEINYCKVRKSFYYETDKVLAIGFVANSKIKGGEKNKFDIFENNYQRPIFSDSDTIYLCYQK
jgi:biotin operon repressor